MEKVIYDSHMHTPLSMHSTGWPVDYAKVAIEKNFKGICFTDHAPVVKYPWVQDFWTIPERIFDSYFSLIKFTKEYIGDALDIRLGVEVDFVHNNQDMDYLRSIINYAPYDYILGSVHATKQYLWDNIYYKGDILETLKKVFRDVIDSALSGLFDCIAHLDYIKYHIPYKYWRPELLEKEIEELLDAIQSEGICMEVNTAGLLFTPPSLYPDDFIIKMAYERGIPVVVSSDAHSPDRVGAGFKEAYEKLLSIGYEEVNYFSKRKRHSYKIKDALKFL